MEQVQGGPPQGGGGDLAQMVAAVENALKTLAQIEGPGAKEFQMAYEAFEAGIESMQGGGGSPQAMPNENVQAGGNPNAKPMG
jgi:hypothetical protein